MNGAYREMKMDFIYFENLQCERQQTIAMERIRKYEKKANKTIRSKAEEDLLHGILIQ